MTETKLSTRNNLEEITNLSLTDSEKERIFKALLKQIDGTPPPKRVEAPLSWVERLFRGAYGYVLGLF